MKPPRSADNELILGLVSVSDRASQGIYEDKGIPALEAWCRKAVKTPVKIHKRLIADERFDIEKTLRELVDIVGCDLILTTGGTGPARRDVTPEATLAVATREMPGFGEQMRAISGHFVPTAILSRQVGVLRETPDHAALILNLPGQPKAIAETLEGLKDESGKSLVNGIFAAVPYCIDLIGGPYIETNEEVVKAFRPKSARRTASQSADSHKEAAAAAPEAEPKAEHKPAAAAAPQSEPQPAPQPQPKAPAFAPKDILTVMPRSGLARASPASGFTAWGLTTVTLRLLPTKSSMSAVLPAALYSPMLRCARSLAVLTIRRCVPGTIFPAETSTMPRMSSAFERPPLVLHN